MKTTTQAGAVDVAKAAAALGPAATGRIESAVRSLRAARAEKLAATDTAVEQGRVVYALLERAGLVTVSVDLPVPGTSVTATLVETYPRTVDVERLEALLPTETFELVTKRAIDLKALDAAVTCGLVSSEVIAEVVSKGNVQSVRLTETAVEAL